MDGSKGDDPENKDVSPRGPGGGTLALALSPPRVDILDPASLVHRQICKYYEEPDNFFIGKILSYRLPEGDDDPELSGKVLYHVKYEDGDEADYVIEELAPLLTPKIYTKKTH